MSARRIVVATIAIVALLAIASLWWRHGTSVFLSSLGGTICDSTPLPRTTPLA